MPNPEDLGPTIAQLKAEIESLKAIIAGMVPSAERDAMKKDLEAARTELADLKKKAAEATPPATPPARSRLSDHFWAP